MDWGQNGDKWVKLVPIGEDVGLDRTYQDENGVLRAQHQCSGWTAAVQVVKLAAPISADHIIGQAAVELSADAEVERVIKRKRKRSEGLAGDMIKPLKHMRGRKASS